MTNKSVFLDDDLHAYLVAHGPTPDAVVTELMAETRRVLPKRAGMQVAPEQAAFLELFAKLVGARYAVEVGTFTGLSSIALARGMGPEGRLLCCAERPMVLPDEFRKFLTDPGGAVGCDAAVVAVDPGARSEDGQLHPLDLKVGDRILIGKWSGTEVKIEGTDYLILKESDVMGVIEGAGSKKKAA